MSVDVSSSLFCSPSPWFSVPLFPPIPLSLCPSTLCPLCPLCPLSLHQPEHHLSLSLTSLHFSLVSHLIVLHALHGVLLLPLCQLVLPQSESPPHVRFQHRFSHTANHAARMCCGVWTLNSWLAISVQYFLFKPVGAKYKPEILAQNHKSTRKNQSQPLTPNSSTLTPNFSTLTP